jgi:hypothetical protein
VSENASPVHFFDQTTSMRTNAAKQWQPDSFSDAMIDLTAQFIVASERAAAHLRLLDLNYVQQLWARAQADF